MRASLVPFALLAFALSTACAPADDEDATTGAAPTGPGAGGGGTGGASGGAGGIGGEAAWSDCDPLVPSHCSLPFPSSRWTQGDPESPTGRRLHFGATTLPKFNGEHMDPTLWATRDGFSTGGALLTDLPGATTTGLPTQDDIPTSLAADSPTILIDAETGERIAHFSELDVSAASEDDDRAFMMRPVVRMKDGTRYIVAIRNVLDAGGTPIEPSPAFRALRDGMPFDDASIEGRRALYDDIFTRLDRAGVARDDLQIAWDYTTASTESNTAWLLHMRDEALATVGADGPTYVIDTVEEDPNPFIRRRILGRMTVPLYMTEPGPGAKLVFGPDGMPEQNGTAEYEFLVHIPHSATMGTPRALLQNGHGLLGKKTEGENGYLAQIAEEKGFVAFSVDFIGMADDDFDTISDSITSDISLFENVIERQHQGMLNSLLAMRMMKNTFWKAPEVQFNGVSAIDPTECYYRGDSQGGIFGTTYMALSTDVTRGLLGEPGMPYNLLLNRSTDFEPFFLGLLFSFGGRGRDIQVVLGLVQTLWDRTEPNGWVPFITDPLPNTPAHEVMLHVAIGDYQVTPLGAHIIARAVAAKNLSPVNRSIWGIDEAPGPLMAGSSMIEFSFGLPDAPKTNVPPTGLPEDDPHDKVRELQAARDMTDAFLRTGVTQPACTGPCDPE